jgi:preprotein translocase SecE subunit
LTDVINYTSGSKKITEMKKITFQGLKKLFEEIKKELLLVTWPAKKDLITSVTVVGIAVLISGSFFFIGDYFLHKAVQFLIKL